MPKPAAHYDLAAMIGADRLARGLWWGRSLDLVAGCSPVDYSCARCWSAAQAHRFARHPHPGIRQRNQGLTDQAGQWTGEVRLNWREAMDKIIKARPTVWAVWTDLFHHEISDLEIGASWRAMADAPQHVFCVLTKRIHRAANLLPKIVANMQMPPPANILVGTTVADDFTAWRIDVLADTPAARRFVSYEPYLGPTDWTARSQPPSQSTQERIRQIDWLIAGPETGPGARPSPLDFARQARDAAAICGVPFFYKGSRWRETKANQAPEVGKDAQDRTEPHRGLVATKPVRSRRWCYRCQPKRQELDGCIWHELPELPQEAKNGGH